MVRSGASWSGRERNCVFLNLGGKKFANVSGVSGLDWLDDGRALAVCDWDRDGDLDLWCKNRTGPQIRLMENSGPTSNFVSLRLVGTDCNADAIGARVEVWAAGRKLVQTIQAGSGYLAQSSKRLHFGLGSATSIERIVVRWPGGKTETLPAATVGFHHRYRQDSGQMDRRIVTDARSDAYVAAGANSADANETEQPRQPPHATSAELESRTDRRTILREPFPLPNNWLHDNTDGDSEITLATFWAEWCPNCRLELSEFSKHTEELHREGIRILPLNLDGPADRDRARKVLAGFELDCKFVSVSESQSTLIAAMLRSVLDLHDDLPIPMNLLLDSKGRVVIVYRGSVSVDDVIRDRRFLTRGAPSTLAAGGRWYSLANRRYADLVDELKDAGLLDWARFYLKLDRQAKGR